MFLGIWHLVLGVEKTKKAKQIARNEDTFMLIRLSLISDNDPDGLVRDLQNSFNVNVIGPIQTVNAFIPLLRNGIEKKVITISTGVADPDLINRLELAVSAPYAISKAGVNMAVAKFSALYKREGILFMAISPGLVDTGGLIPSKCTF